MVGDNDFARWGRDYSSDFIMSDIVTNQENQFALADLLKCEYFKRQRESFSGRELWLPQPLSELCNIAGRPRGHPCLQRAAREVSPKRFRDGSRDWRDCEAIFSEVIVYRAYIRGVYEGVIRSIHLEEAEADIIVERLDGSRMFLEVFCVMPSFPLNDDHRESNVYSVKTHTQTEMASIRQKLLSQDLETEPTLEAA